MIFSGAPRESTSRNDAWKTQDQGPNKTVDPAFWSVSPVAHQQIKTQAPPGPTAACNLKEVLGTLEREGYIAQGSR